MPRAHGRRAARARPAARPAWAVVAWVIRGARHELRSLHPTRAEADGALAACPGPAAGAFFFLAPVEGRGDEAALARRRAGDGDSFRLLLRPLDADEKGWPLGPGEELAPIEVARGEAPA